MNVASSQSSAEKVPQSAIGSFLFFLGGLALWFLVSDYLDPPETWTQCGPPTSAELAELSAQREDFLLVAVPLAGAYGVFLAICAWKWAADRRARQGRERRPGPLALGAAIVLGSLWLLLLANAFTSDEVGGASFGAYLLTGAGVITTAVLALVVFSGAFQDRSSSEVRDMIETMSVGLAWSLLLIGLPWLLLTIAIAGKNATFVC